MPKAIRHPKAPGLYTYAQGEVFNPGVQAFAFKPFYSNPTYLFRGAGRLIAQQFQTTSPGVVLNALALPASGMGGIINGQFFNQPLLNSDLSQVE
jgi:hypothetical protein